MFGSTFAILAVAASGAPAGMALVGPVTLETTLEVAPGQRTVSVPAFWLDILPVTNAQYLAFVRANEKWRRDKVPRLFASEQYLSHWRSPLDLLDQAAASEPVTQVSWFAAVAYCETRGARLPTENEWEAAAAASVTKKDARKDPEFRRRILDWYARPATERPGPVGRSAPNAWGIRDLHALVWEWVLDFNSVLLGEDGRDRGSPDSSRFCGAAALYAKDPDDYAAIMRSALRSALEARYTTSRLGFRCARDASL